MKKSESLNKEKDPKLTRRRSKNEQEGRTFICSECHKSYLSYPALYTHHKIKHETNKNLGRGRGRPKKEQNENIIEKNRYNPINITFFAKEERTGKTSLSEINNCIETAYVEIYLDDYKSRNESRNMKNYNNSDEQPFLDKFKKDSHDIYKNIINMHAKADTVFIDYLNKMSNFCKPDYFVQLIKFVTLFREHINISNNNNKDNKEYTEINDAENIPDYCNSFINQFLYPKGNNNNDFLFQKEESIDLIQNICYWMFDNNFTSTKILLKK